MTVVVSGATGTLGREVVRLLAGRGTRVRALGRNQERLAALDAFETRRVDLRSSSSLAGVCEGASGLIIASGASMRLGGWGDRTPFHSIDYLAHLRLLDEARRAGVRRIVAVSLAGALAVRHTEYAQAHEQFVQALAASGVSHCVVRPTGFFSMFLALLDLAQRGVGFVPGDGHAKTNPIHEAEVAQACVEALENDEREMVIGGPEVFTRVRLAELSFEALGRPPRIRRAPGWVVSAAVIPLAWAHPRLGALVRFGLAAGAVDLVAPAYGVLRLGDYLREHAASLRAARGQA